MTEITQDIESFEPFYIDPYGNLYLKPIGTKLKNYDGFDKGFFFRRYETKEIDHLSTYLISNGDYYKLDVNIKEYLVEISKKFNIYVFEDDKELIWWLSKP
jgi:hypothetical protein